MVLSTTKQKMPLDNHLLHGIIPLEHTFMISMTLQNEWHMVQNYNGRAAP